MKQSLSNKRSVLGLIGFLYGTVLAVLGFASSGGGHSNVIYVLAIAPYGAGFILWPILGMLTFDLSSSWSRILFLLLMAIHYIACLLYFCQNWESEIYWFDVATEFAGIVALFILSLLVYVLGQLFLWHAFLTRRKTVFS